MSKEVNTKNCEMRVTLIYEISSMFSPTDDQCILDAMRKFLHFAVIFNTICA